MNINEIAKMAGVSRAAVSRYLNNGYVSEEKKEQIRKVIEKTGYRPSYQAQMLRTKKTKMIGVILPKINSQSIGRMVAGISDVIDENGYQLLLANTKNNVDEEIKYLNTFRENHVDGIIFMATVLTNKHKKVLSECNMPIVVLGQQLQGYSCVYQDDYHAAKTMTEVLLEHGNNPGFIGVLDGDRAVGYHRRQGYEDALTEKGLPVKEQCISRADFTIASGYEVMKELYEKAPDIDSVLCVTESIAIGAQAYLKDAGIKIPEEVMIAGMGDSPVSKVLSPKISTIHFHYKTSGIEAAKILLDEIENASSVKKELRMSYEVMLGESTI